MGWQCGGSMGITDADYGIANAEYPKPVPRFTAANLPYWRATRAHELRLPRCRDCGRWVYPIAQMCQQCWSEDLVWSALSGSGTVSSWVVVHRAFDPSFAADVPYMVVQVELEEGMRFISHVIDVAPTQMYAGMPVVAVFEDVTDEVTLVKFRRRVDV
jgi:uncharacterized protein